MQRIFNLEEALAELSKKTGSEWTHTDLFHAAMEHQIDLHAAPPPGTKTDVWRWTFEDRLRKVHAGFPWQLALLTPQSVMEIWQVGEAEVSNVDTPKNNGKGIEAGGVIEYRLYAEPVRIRREDVRVSAASVQKLAQLKGPAEKPIGARERDTLLTIIAVLCKDAGYDYAKAAKTAAAISSSAAAQGISIGETTIEGHLKKAANALASRMK